MGGNERDPVLDEWLRDSKFGEGGFHMKMDQLAAMQLVAEQTAEACPDRVLERWYMLLTRHRRVGNQSERAFLAQARRRGWAWDRIAAVLGLPDAAAAEQRQEFLSAELTRTHPSQDPQPWLPWGDPRVQKR
ncbi:hypothetical protein GCM10010174_34000 [Kutzneria viridogrisea]|uniref:Uncharacterized protein n=2 Tax=Kutzneria TaxID=43356 RepID=W5W8I4_9PSEU|nr:hypothetical protein [Kutzneria albida]AHH96846.1 hypothetical protein KALB_3481 [Kutzneria albida DSM 43870]MBA8927932.1 hypothetical protein [Kutzneria viridogrisea]